MLDNMDFAFNNYCIGCDKICAADDIYCSDYCRSLDEQQSTALTKNLSLSLSNKSASPSITPSLYEHQQDGACSPLCLAQSPPLEENDNFSLNYLLSSDNDTDSHYVGLNPLYMTTSHNYKKWLTACL